MCVIYNLNDNQRAIYLGQEQMEVFVSYLLQLHQNLAGR